jgi:uncharacterized RDD family membrane protein YckC
MRYLIKRLVAFMLDVIIIMLPFDIIADIFGYSVSTFGTGYNLYQLVSVIVMLVYFCMCDFFFGRSLGKIILKLEIKGYKKGQNRQLFKQVIFRNLMRFVPLDQISIFFYDDKRMWHDMVSKTQVVDNAKK